MFLSFLEEFFFVVFGTQRRNLSSFSEFKEQFLMKNKNLL
jgi:hypothetical protein